MKEKRVKILVWATIILLVLNISVLGTLVYYRITEKPPTPFFGKGEHHKFMEKELNFNEEQIESFNELRVKHHKSMKPVIKEIQETKRAIFSELKNGGTQQDKIDSLHNRIGMLHKHLSKLSEEHYRSLMEVCNEEQKEKLHTIMQRTSRGPEGPGFEGNHGRRRPGNQHRNKN
jgi:Spy/CpxP family protein refolding chaperone